MHRDLIERRLIENQNAWQRRIRTVHHCHVPRPDAGEGVAENRRVTGVSDGKLNVSHQLPFVCE
jgi:hypothetical protein